MKDRVPVNPGRVLVTPENGSAAYYATIKRADNPTQEGTPLNKNSLLKDATAALFGLGADAVPDDVFGVLSRFQSGLGNEYVWEKGKYVTEPDGKNVTGSAVYASNTYTTWKYSSSFSASDGSVSLVNPSTGSSSISIATFAANITGKYCSYEHLAGGAIIYVTAASKTDNQTMSVTYQLVKSVYTFYGYVNSPNVNAYPLNDGYTYKRIGQVGSKVKSGSYVGTGTYGSSNPNSLTFDFVPKFVVVLAKGGNTIYGGNVGFMWFSGSSVVFNTANTGYAISTAVNGTTLSWYYSGTSSGYQFNFSGTTYNYLAFC